MQTNLNFELATLSTGKWEFWVTDIHQYTLSHAHSNVAPVPRYGSTISTNEAPLALSECPPRIFELSGYCPACIPCHHYMIVSCIGDVTATCNVTTCIRE